MKKRLISENEKLIKQQSEYFQRVADCCNKVNEAFERFNYFNHELTEVNRWELVRNPVQYFDSLLLAANPLPTLKGIAPSIEKIAEMLGLDRQGFINACTMPSPSGGYRGNIPNSLFKLNNANEPLLLQENGVFTLNLEALEDYKDRFRVYAETEQDFKLVETVENIVNSINTGLQLGIINKIHVGTIYKLCNLVDSRGYECVVHHKNLGFLIEMNRKQAVKMSV
ncbi:MAG TPA: hypothetical protein VIO15_10340 [Bacteroidales bacterium]